MGFTSDSVEVRLKLNGEVVRDYAVNTGGRRGLTIDGLLPNTVYSVQLRTNCEAEYLGMADWTKEREFQTSCEPHFPIDYDFNDWLNVSSCWQVEREDGKDAGLTVTDAYDHDDAGRSVAVAAGNVGQDVYTLNLSTMPPMTLRSHFSFITAELWAEISR